MTRGCFQVALTNVESGVILECRTTVLKVCAVVFRANKTASNEHDGGHSDKNGGDFAIGWFAGGGVLDLGTSGGFDLSRRRSNHVAQLIG